MRKIANDSLTLKDVPSRNAGWRKIAEFALTFNDYEMWGSFEKCAEIANAKRQDSLTGLRTCLWSCGHRWSAMTGGQPRSTRT